MRKVFNIELGMRSEFSNLSLFYGGDEIGDYHFFYDQFIFCIKSYHSKLHLFHGYHAEL